MFAALSMPETRDYVSSKLKKFLALAPIVYVMHQENKIIHDFAEFEEEIKMITDKFGIYDILRGACNKSSAQSRMETEICEKIPSVCKSIIGISDANPVYDNMDRIPYIASHIPSGSSTQNILHYAQFASQNKKKYPVFRKYDRGLIGNLVKYKSFEPPVMDLTSINKKLKIRGFVGKEDKFGNLTDEAILYSDLTKAGVNYKSYTYDNMGHLSFVISKDPSKLFADIINEIRTD